MSLWSRIQPEGRPVQHCIHAFVRPVVRHPRGQIGEERLSVGALSLCARVHAGVADYVATQYVPARRKFICTPRFVRLAAVVDIYLA